MQPPVQVPDPANPTFVARNAAETFDPFDPIALNWTATATDADRAVALADFNLGLRLTATATTRVYAPTQGYLAVRSNAGLGGGVKTLQLELSDEARRLLHMSGRGETVPLPAAPSTMTWQSFSGDRVQVRFLFTVETPALENRLRTQLEALYTNELLKREFPDDYDLRIVNDELTVIDLPAGTREAKYFQPWYNGESKVAWKLGGDKDQRYLIDLEPTESLVLHALVRDGYGGGSTDHWFLCNVGFVLRNLGVTGDPADPATDAAYEVISGGSVRRISSGGTFESGGTNPDGENAHGFDQVVVVHGGSQDAVLLQPPGNKVTSGCFFSYSTAEDVCIFSPRFSNLADADVGPGWRVWQPTYSWLDIGAAKNWVGEQGGNAAHLPDIGAADAILTTEYGQHATRYPAGVRRSVFFDFMDRAYGYDGTRARPPEGSAPSPSPATTSWEHIFNVNEYAAIRPEHPIWQRQRLGQLRRLYPLRLEVRLGHASDSPVLCVLSQDDVDCVRQEYIFHMRWESAQDYYQTYAGQSAWWRNNRVFTAEGPRIIEAGGPPQTRPAIGWRGNIVVPGRRTVRPVENTPPGASGRYRFTQVVNNWSNLLDEIDGLGEHYADRIRVLFTPAGMADRSDIRNAIAASVDYPDPVLPSWGAEIAVRIYDMTEPGPGFPAGSIDEFLRVRLTTSNTRARFTALNPFEAQISSSWRSPEYNETVSTTPISNHQLGEAFDVQPRDAGGAANRNPLAMLCLHIAGLHIAAQNTAAGHSRLRELLMENNAHEYLVGRVNPETRGQVILRNVVADGSVAYVQRQPDGSEVALYDAASLAGEEITTRTPLDRRLAMTFTQEYSNFMSTSGLWPTPPPTQRDLQTFALTIASHVHFTWWI